MMARDEAVEHLGKKAMFGLLALGKTAFLFQDRLDIQINLPRKNSGSGARRGSISQISLPACTEGTNG
jgi:hypothetical protein